MVLGCTPVNPGHGASAGASCGQHGLRKTRVFNDKMAVEAIRVTAMGMRIGKS
jgi:hypothetical protein